MRDLLELERDSLRPELVGRLVRVVEDERGHGLAIAVEGARRSRSPTTARRCSNLAIAEKGLSVAADHDDLVRTSERAPHPHRTSGSDPASVRPASDPPTSTPSS